MPRRPLPPFALALAILSTPLPAVEPAAAPERSAAEIMQSVFGNRLRDGGFWREENPDYRPGSGEARYWMQLWRNGPGDEVVIVDAWEVKGDDACHPLFHIVFTYDRASDRIHSRSFGAQGIAGQGVAEYAGTVTTNEVRMQLPGGQELRLRDREDQGTGDAVVVAAERWNGTAWEPGKSVTWRRSDAGLPCRAGG